MLSLLSRLLQPVEPKDGELVSEATVQRNLHGESVEDVTESEETKVTRIFRAKRFYVKIGEDALESLLEEKKSENSIEYNDRILHWVQAHMRVATKENASEGEWDRDSKVLLERIMGA